MVTGYSEAEFIAISTKIISFDTIIIVITRYRETMRRVVAKKSRIAADIYKRKTLGQHETFIIMTLCK